MTETTAIHTCFDRIVPEHHDPVRAKIKRLARAHFERVAREHEMTTADLPELDADHPVFAAYMALVVHSVWPRAYVLRCRFLDGEAAWQQKVIRNAKIWEQYANVSLSFGNDPEAEIRISFFADAGSWSAIGQDCLVESYFPRDRPTMNFGWLRDDTADEEYERVVVHEFGHALGCIHEHQSPMEHLDWNVPAVYAAFSGPPNNWSQADIDHNILQKYAPRGVTSSVFDRDSIMLYQFAGSLFRNGIGTPLNTHLSPLDERMIAQLYPR